MSQLLARLEELSRLEAGWLDGDGIAPTRKARSVAEALVTRCEDLLTGLQVFPTPEGGLLFETPDDSGFEISVAEYGGARAEGPGGDMPKGVPGSVALDLGDPLLRPRLAASRRLFSHNPRRDAPFPDPFTESSQALRAIAATSRNVVSGLPERVQEQVVLAAPDLLLEAPRYAPLPLETEDVTGPDGSSVLIWYDEPIVFQSDCGGMTAFVMRLPDGVMGVSHLVIVPSDEGDVTSFDLRAEILSPSSRVFVCANALDDDAQAVPFPGEIPEAALPDPGLIVEVVDENTHRLGTPD